MDEVLMDRYVLFEDELSMVIEERGGTPESLTVESVLEKVYAQNLGSKEMEATLEREMEEVILRYRREIEEPAEVILRERKASRPSAVKKVAVAITGSYDIYDAAFYREALDGIEPHIPQLAEPPALTSLVLRVSWPGKSALRRFPAGAFISSADENVLVLYVGPYRPGFASPGFYLVYDSWANSVTVVPQLPSRSVTSFSHCSIGTGVAVLRHEAPSEYVLVELLPHQDNAGLLSNVASVFIWHSSGPVAGRWMEKEVTLPLPSEPEEHTSEPSYIFFADTVFAVGTTCLCWVDLLQGILVCDYVLADHPEFRLVRLPSECSFNIKPDPEDDWEIPARGQPTQYRSMCCVKRGDEHIIKFISMHGHGQVGHMSGVALTIWTLDQPCDPMSKWKQGRKSFHILDLWSDPSGKRQLLPLLSRTPSFPVISMLQDDVIYISVGDMVDDWKAHGPCILSLSMKGQRVLSAFMPPPGTRVFPLPDIFASPLTSYLNKRNEWSQAMHQKSKGEARDWRKREKSVMLSASSDAMEMRPQHFRHAQLPTGLRSPSAGRPSPRIISRRSNMGPSVGLVSLLDDFEG